MALNYYAYVNNYRINVEPVKPYPEPEKKRVMPINPGQPKEIILAEYSTYCGDLITAHKLRDYRKRTYTLLMLPDVKLPIDALLEI
jgi:hypothetical protein